MPRGGARVGAGRPPKPREVLQVPEGEDPLKFLLSVMNDPKAAAALRVRAAVAAVQYTHAKRGEGGKKDDRQAAAEKAARGRFSAGKPPRLVVNNG